MRIRTWKYKDGFVISEEWSDLLDGKWPYGKEEEKIFIMNENWNKE